MTTENSTEMEVLEFIKDEFDVWIDARRFSSEVVSSLWSSGFIYKREDTGIPRIAISIEGTGILWERARS